jgi:predicted transcriptional regulator
MATGNGIIFTLTPQRGKGVSMAKVSVIKLTAKDVVSGAKKNEAGEFFTVREVEISALENLFVLAANMQRDIRKINVCYDLIQEVKSITDDMDSFKITGTDLKDLLIPAIEKMVDNRPGFWFFARAMFKSIEKPEEIDV